MRSRLVLAPRWLLSVLNGVLFGGLELAITGSRTDGGWAGSLVGALVGGVLFGLFMGALIAARNRRVVALADLDDRDELLAALRASHRGPAPADPRVRSAAARIALDRLREAEGQYRLTVSSLAVGALVFVAMAVLLSPWWLIAALFVAGAAVQAFRLPIGLSRRVILLGEPQDETAPVTPAS